MGKFTEYKIALASMPQGEHQFNFHLGKVFFDNMENTDIHNADLDVALTVNHKADLYTFDFHVTGTITLICDRCLDDLVMPVDTTYNINVKYGEEYNDDNDDLLVIPFSDSYLNVAYIIHDTVALTIPIKHVHPLGKCNRQMSAVLKKHRAAGSDGEEADLEASLIEEMETMDSAPADIDAPTDPRWDALKTISRPDGDDQTKE